MYKECAIVVGYGTVRKGAVVRKFLKEMTDFRGRIRRCVGLLYSQNCMQIGSMERNLGVDQ